MPTSKEHDIIDLTEVVEEGHPDRPNLRSAKPTAQPSSGEVEGDMDLEMEIDQIFSDLGPSGAAAASGGAGRQAASTSDEDTLDLDELFAAEKPSAAKAGARSKANDVPDDAPSQADQVDPMDLGDGFDDLFADLEKSSEPPAREAETASDQEVKTKNEDIFAEIQDQLPEDGGEDVSGSAPEEKADSVSDEISAQPPGQTADAMADHISDEIFEESPEKTTDESPGERPGDRAAQTQRKASPTPPEPAPDEISDELDGTEAGEEADDLHFPAEEDKAETPPAAAKDLAEDQSKDLAEEQAQKQAQEQNIGADVIQKLQARINALEERLAEVAAEKASPVPNMDELLQQVDEHIANAPALAQLGEGQEGLKAQLQEQTEKASQGLQDLEARVAEAAENASTGPDMDELLQQVDERIANAPALARLGEEQEGVKAELEAGLKQLAEKSSQGLQELEAKVAEAAEKAPTGPDMDELLQQVDERIANAPALARLGEEQEGVKAELEAGLKQLAEKSSQGLQELEAKVDQAARQTPTGPDMDELLQRVDERIANAPALRAMAEEHAQAMQKQQDAAHARLEKIEERLDNFFEHLARLKEGMEGIVGSVVDGRLENMAAEQEKQLADLRTQILEQSESRLKDALREAAQTSAEHLDARIAEAMAANQPDPAEMTAKLEQLREDLLQELQTAVPEAAARIIREEIQALSQDES
jgi:hypothetical protein